MLGLDSQVFKSSLHSILMVTQGTDAPARTTRTKAGTKKKLNDGLYICNSSSDKLCVAIQKSQAVFGSSSFFSVLEISAKPFTT